jgi:hypothetical protein
MEKLKEWSNLPFQVEDKGRGSSNRTDSFPYSQESGIDHQGINTGDLLGREREGGGKISGQSNQRVGLCRIDGICGAILQRDLAGY